MLIKSQVEAAAGTWRGRKLEASNGIVEFKDTHTYHHVPIHRSEIAAAMVSPHFQILSKCICLATADALRGLPRGLSGKEPACNAGNAGDRA